MTDTAHNQHSETRRPSDFYPSQLASETAPVYDIHFKPVEPISARLTFSINF